MKPIYEDLIDDVNLAYETIRKTRKRQKELTIRRLTEMLKDLHYIIKYIEDEEI